MKIKTIKKVKVTYYGGLFEYRKGVELDVADYFGRFLIEKGLAKEVDEKEKVTTEKAKGSDVSKVKKEK